MAEAGTDGRVDSGVDLDAGDAGGSDAGSDSGFDSGFDSGNADAAGGPPDSGTDAGASPPVTAGLLAWYRFEDTPDDDDEVLDSSGNNRNGSCTVGDCPTVATGRVGLAYDFDGVDDYVLIDDSDGYFDGTAGFTVAFWTFVRDSPGASIVAKPFGPDFSNSWQVSAFPPSQIQLSVIVGRDPPPNSLTVDQWEHYTATWDGASARLYRGGVEITAFGTTASFDTSPIVVGGDLNRVTQFATPLNGLVDELLIYDRALSPGEVVMLANP